MPKSDSAWQDAIACAVCAQAHLHMTTHVLGQAPTLRGMLKPSRTWQDAATHAVCAKGAPIHAIGGAGRAELTYGLEAVQRCSSNKAKAQCSRLQWRWKCGSKYNSVYNIMYSAGGARLWTAPPDKDRHSKADEGSEHLLGKDEVGERDAPSQDLAPLAGDVLLHLRPGPCRSSGPPHPMQGRGDLSKRASRHQPQTRKKVMCNDTSQADAGSEQECLTLLPMLARDLPAVPAPGQRTLLASRQTWACSWTCACLGVQTREAGVRPARGPWCGTECGWSAPSSWPPRRTCPAARSLSPWRQRRAPPVNILR